MDLSHPNAPATFLPSVSIPAHIPFLLSKGLRSGVQEATRINTPPMSPVSDGHTRGFFFELSPPLEDGDKTSPTSAGSRLLDKNQPLASAGGRDWWDVANPEDTLIALEKRELRARQAQFELNLPEHFPTSPLCPRNPKHKSGGTGICVYHGR